MKKPLAIFTSDNNPFYTEFSTITTKAWELIDFQPVYLKVGSEQYPEIKGVPTSLQAQILRLYAPTNFPEVPVIISDIDMLPLDKNYFMSKIPLNDKDFVIYSADAYAKTRYPMCYVASYGKNFSIFLENEKESWRDFVVRLNNLNLGWDTDELYMTTVLEKSSVNKVKYNRGWVNGVALNRLDRVQWHARGDDVYFDAHCPRPYSKYKNQIEGALKTYATK